MISNENLLEVYNYLSGVYVSTSNDSKKSLETFRKLLQEEVYKQYSNKEKVSMDLITDLLIGYTLCNMINAKEDYNTLHFEYYFSYSYSRYNSGKKEMAEKFAIMSDKLLSYNINKFVVDYRYFADGSVRKFGTNLETVYDVGFKLVDIEKGYLLFEKNEE